MRLLFYFPPSTPSAPSPPHTITHSQPQNMPHETYSRKKIPQSVRLASTELALASQDVSTAL